ncbi:MAG TPA: GAF domain-containing sensor histidine kinase [Caldilineae bacterium]|nr:GAF domain-containing sensor histidine kinase [Caldilineae bacterium]
MNPVSAFFLDHLILIYLVYGLAFVGMGLMVLATCRQGAVSFRFSLAIRPLIFFGLLHGVHEWIEMFQLIALQTDQVVPSVSQEWVRLVILAASFLLLLAFGILLLYPERISWRKLLMPLAAFIALWGLGIVVARVILQPSPLALTQIADVLARYGLAIPGALLAVWALMRQQRTFREQDMSQFGRYLVWAATTMFLFGVVSQAFGPKTQLAPSHILNSAQFMAWFGIPVQLFRAVVVVVFTYFLLKALGAFEMERQRQLDAANKAQIAAQQAQVETERKNRREVERLNEELRSTTYELALLLDLANILVAPIALDKRLHAVLEELVQNVHVCDHSLILLAGRNERGPEVAAAVGFEQQKNDKLYFDAMELGAHAIAKGRAMCQRLDGTILDFDPTNEEERRRCQEYPSPMTLLCIPLYVHGRTIGCLIFGWPIEQARAPFSLEEFRLVFAATQQLGLSIEHARLSKEAQDREKLLADLLHQVVEAQEAERKRIARELHDASGQSLTALSLGLRGVESILIKEQSAAVKQVHELGAISTQALGELRQIIADLRPSHLDDLGLIPALRWYFTKIEERYALRMRFEVSGVKKRLPAECETILFRITQEAITNVIKHADANEVQIHLVLEPPQVNLRIVDDGKGFNPSEFLSQKPTLSGWGLLGMQERVSLLGGRMHIDSAPGEGTRISVTVFPVTWEQIDGGKNEVTAG